MSAGAPLMIGVCHGGYAAIPTPSFADGAAARASLDASPTRSPPSDPLYAAFVRLQLHEQIAMTRLLEGDTPISTGAFAPAVAEELAFTQVLQRLRAAFGVTNPEAHNNPRAAFYAEVSRQHQTVAVSNMLPPEPLVKEDAQHSNRVSIVVSVCGYSAGFAPAIHAAVKVACAESALEVILLCEQPDEDDAAAGLRGLSDLLAALPGRSKIIFIGVQCDSPSCSDEAEVGSNSFAQNLVSAYLASQVQLLDRLAHALKEQERSFSEGIAQLRAYEDGERARLHQEANLRNQVSSLEQFPQLIRQANNARYRAQLEAQYAAARAAVDAAAANPSTPQVPPQITVESLTAEVDRGLASFTSGLGSLRCLTGAYVRFRSYRSPPMKPMPYDVGGEEPEFEPVDEAAPVSAWASSSWSAAGTLISAAPVVSAFGIGGAGFGEAMTASPQQSGSGYHVGLGVSPSAASGSFGGLDALSQAASMSFMPSPDQSVTTVLARWRAATADAVPSQTQYHSSHARSYSQKLVEQSAPWLIGFSSHRATTDI
jgi:hypothetical protein